MTLTQSVPHLFLLAGEHSGDVYGGKLLHALKQKNPSLKAVGVGGPSMRAQGLECLLPMEDFQVMGFGDIVRSLPALFRQFYKLRDHILSTNPMAVVLIDYPGFNLRLAKALRKKGYKGKIVQYVCPTVWIWGKGRIHTLATNVDLLLTIFPFEPALFQKTPLKTVFIGHPLVESLQKHEYDPAWTQKVGLAGPDNIIALFPGSRAGEVMRLFKRQLEASLRLRQQDSSLQIAVSCTDEKLKELITTIADTCGAKVGQDVFLVPREHTYDLMKTCRTAIAKSGTVNLELALHHKPCVVVYEVSTFNYLILWYIVRLHLDFYSIVNILREQQVYPELVTETFSTQQLLDAVAPLHREGLERTTCIEGCRQVQESLATSQTQVASQQAATAIGELCLL